jgi:DNA-binding HxlR family transcriptional regulator
VKGPRVNRTSRLRVLPALVYQNDPILQSVQALSRKWILLLVRDLAFLSLNRFGEFRRNNPGLSPRVLSRRLREMEREGLIVREVDGREVRYRLTARGQDATLILLAFLQYGLKHQVGPLDPDFVRFPPTKEGRLNRRTRGLETKGGR